MADAPFAKLEKLETRMAELNRIAERVHNASFHKDGAEYGYCALWGSMCNGNWFQRMFHRARVKFQKNS